VPGYQTDRLLGKTSLGAELWAGTGPDGRPVVVKVFRDLAGALGKFDLRAQDLLTRLKHRHLLRFHGAWVLDVNGAVASQAPGKPPDADTARALVLISDQAPKSLLHRLKECQGEGQVGIPVKEVIVYLAQAAKALDFLNAAQHSWDGRPVSLQHRDIRPENLLLSNGTLKVSGFDLTCVVEGDSVAVPGKQLDFTPAYMAPERAKGVVSSKTDQYALALTYCKLRTGALPFEVPGTVREVVRLHAEGKLDLDRLLTVDRNVIARATALKPTNRFPSCTVMVQALQHAWGLTVVDL
jgi:serine/threonine-protein kinase